MAKVRVYELAKELGLESKALVSWLKDNGEFVRSASSTVVLPKTPQARSTEIGTKERYGSTVPASAVRTETAGRPRRAAVSRARADRVGFSSTRRA